MRSEGDSVHFPYSFHGSEGAVSVVLSSFPLYISVISHGSEGVPCYLYIPLQM